MNCLNHPEQAAVAICTNCGMGICTSCAQRSKSEKFVCSLACGDKIDTLMQTGQEAITRGARSRRLTGWYLLILGVGFVAWGSYSWATHGWGAAAYFLVAGAFMFVFGVIYKSAPNPSLQPTVPPSASLPSQAPLLGAAELARSARTQMFERITSNPTHWYLEVARGAFQGIRYTRAGSRSCWERSTALNKRSSRPYVHDSHIRLISHLNPSPTIRSTTSGARSRDHHKRRRTSRSFVARSRRLSS